MPIIHITIPSPPQHTHTDTHTHARSPSPRSHHPPTTRTTPEHKRHPSHPPEILSPSPHHTHSRAGRRRADRSPVFAYEPTQTKNPNPGDIPRIQKMLKTDIRAMTRDQAKRQAIFQRQLLNDLFQYIRQDPKLTLTARNGLHQLQTTLYSNIRVLELQSRNPCRESLTA